MSQVPVILENPQMFFPKLFTAVSKTVPHVDISAEQAVLSGYSFRKKSRSVKITKYNGRSHREMIIPYSIDGLPVDEIGDGAFSGCICSTIYIHGNIRRLGKRAFAKSTVKEVIFEDGLTSLSESVFASCKELATVELPLTLKNIGYRCFLFCENLKYIEFPKSICNIEDQAFQASGLENFGVESLTTSINNADSFTSTPLIGDNQVVCTYPDKSNMTVLHVNDITVKGMMFRLKADSVTFCRNSLFNISLDLSECKKVRFYRTAVRDERPREKTNMSYGVRPCQIILPEKYDDEQHYAFPRHVTVVNYFPQNEKTYNKPYETEYDSENDTCIITPVADFLPPWSVKEDCEKIRITKRVHIDLNAISCDNLKEITFENFCPEDKVFAYNCYKLRKVSFNYCGRIVTKYIPARELISYDIYELMLMAFKPSNVPYGNGFRRSFYDRCITDSFFDSKYVSSDDNQWLDLYQNRQYNAGWIHHKQKISIRVTNKIKAVIAVDILRSDKLEHEPPVDMYYNSLVRHYGFCRNYFRRISDRYPEYLEAFQQIMNMR